MINKQKHKLLLIFSILLAGWIFQACTPEYYVLKRFKETQPISVLIIPNEVILNTNTKISELYPDYKKLPKALQDTIWNANTKFLEKVPDSILISRFYDSFVQQLKLSDIKIFTIDNIKDFNASDTNSYILKIGQMELEENKKRIPYSQPVNYQTEVYKEVEINTITLNVWFELSKACCDTLSTQILYSSDIIGDEVEGRFSQNVNGEYEFQFKRKDIVISNLETLSNNAARKMSQYLYNHLINIYAKAIYQSYDYNMRYIGKQIGNNNAYSIYYPSINERFIEIKKTK